MFYVGPVSISQKQNKEEEAVQEKFVTHSVCVCAFQPSLTCSYSTQMYITGNKEKQEK